MSDVPDDAPVRRQVVLVTGAGRSGTSTVAGTLHLLGFHVPEPVLKGNESNPRGFFESWWPVRFHQRVMTRANVELTDGRPEAYALMQAAVTARTRAQLDAWLADQMDGVDLVVVKDPRAIWLPALWVDAARRLDVELGLVSMLRHPAEVLGSRSTYYAGNRPQMDSWQFAVFNLCGWVNGSLIVERETRDQARSFVRYDDLVGDWRAAMRSVQADLGLRFADDLSSGEHHPVDDFIDPGLRRHAATWAEPDLPQELVDIAEATYAALSRLADTGGHDAAVEQELDDLGARYARLCRVSDAIAHYSVSAAHRAGREVGAREARDEQDKPEPVEKATASAPQTRGTTASLRALVARIPGARRARDYLRSR